ncbi:MAG: dihydroorotase [Chloroflexi bacterium]|nr:dihydroorotase [Chloroflexota bacterium]
MSAPPEGRGLLIRGGRLCDPARGRDEVADLYLSDGKIALESAPAGTPVLEVGGLLISPGFIDLHVHLREPGFEDKETIATGTQAAARGGFTTVCCMPNTEPPTDSRAAVEFILRRAATHGAIRVLPIGCITKGRRGHELAEMGELAAAGVVGFSDDGSPVADSRLMRQAMEYSRAFGLPVIDHCQDPALSQGGVVNEGAVSSRLGLVGMPAAAEEVMVARDIALAELTGACLHLAHLSAASSVEHLRRAKALGLPVTAEVTPHHLALTEGRVMGVLGPLPHKLGPLPASAYDTNAKVNPPLRTERDRQALLAALRAGLIDAIATDHAPHTLVDKECEFDDAAFGISGLETAAGVLLTLVDKGELELTTVIAALTAGPARLLGRPDLGALRAGAAADLVLIDPRAEWAVEPAQFASKGHNTPLAGARLRGKVLATIYGGHIAYLDPALEMKGAPLA